MGERTLDSQTQNSDADDELEKLESDVNQIAEKILEYRQSLPDQLSNTLASILTSQRPVILTHFDNELEPGTSDKPSPESGRPVESGPTTLLAEENNEYAEKAQFLKQTLTSNAFVLPNVLKRMKECISRIDKLESHTGIIHPVFKRRRTS